MGGLMKKVGGFIENRGGGFFLGVGLKIEGFDGKMGF